MRSRKKKILGLVLASSIALCLVGCRQQITMPLITDVTTNMLVIDENGTVTSLVVADFDKDYYVEEELAEMIEAELIEFNESESTSSLNGQPAVLSDMYRTNGKIVVQYTFANGRVFAKYQTTALDCFTGTVREAIAEGYLQDVTLLSVGKGKVLDLSANEKVLEKQIVIWQGSMPVMALSNPQYISENVKLSEADNHTMQIQGAEGEYGFCILK